MLIMGKHINTPCKPKNKYENQDNKNQKFQKL